MATKLTDSTPQSPEFDATPFMSGLSDELPDDLDFGDDFDSEAEDDDAELNTGKPPEVEEDEAEEDEAEEDEAEEETDDEPEEEDESEDDEAEEETDDESEEEEPAPKAKGKKKDPEPRIPKSRMDQALRRARIEADRSKDLERQLAELREQSAPKPMSSEEIKSKMAQANEALVAGDVEKAADLQAEVMSQLYPKGEAKQSQPAGDQDLVSQVEARIELKSVIKSTYERFPELDDNNELFNEEMSDEAVSIQQAFLQRGYTVAEATQKAANAVAKLHDLDDRTASTEKAATPKDTARAEATKKQVSARNKTKVEKATKAAPKLTGKRGEDSDSESVDINNLSEEEFMALPSAVQDRLLGNTI